MTLDIGLRIRRLGHRDGKGGHQRQIPVSGRFFASVAAYLDQERPPDAISDRLFVVLKRSTAGPASVAGRRGPDPGLRPGPGRPASGHLPPVAAHLPDPAARLGTLRMVFVRISYSDWPEAPARVPIIPADSAPTRRHDSTGVGDAVAAALA